MNLLKVGTIATTHGIRGEVKILGDNPCFDKSFKHPLYIGTDPQTTVHIKTAKQAKDRMIVSFQEFDNINQVEGFKGLPIYADMDTLEPLEEDEYYIKDLIGMEVYNEEGEYLGDVLDVRDYPQCQYLVVLHNDKECLIPFIDEFIIDIDETITIHEMEGLL